MRNLILVYVIAIMIIGFMAYKFLEALPKIEQAAQSYSKIIIIP